MAAVKIFFYPQADWARGLRGKRARAHERAGFARCAAASLARTATDADLVYMRNIPEQTTAERLRFLEDSVAAWPATKVINHPSNLYLHDSKDRCFAAWQEAGLSTPEFAVLEELADLEAFIRRHRSVMVRVNNEACGNGTTLLLETDGTEQARSAFERAVARTDSLRRAGREDTRPMAVEFLESHGLSGYRRSYRAFLVAGTVCGGYALISPEPIVNFATAACATEEEVALFLEANSALDRLLTDTAFCDTLQRSVTVLGLDIAAVDFLLVDREPCLLEANALWSPSYRWAGGWRGWLRYRSNRAEWRRRAASYCHWMDRTSFYREMYSRFRLFEGAG